LNAMREMARPPAHGGYSMTRSNLARLLVIGAIALATNRGAIAQTPGAHTSRAPASSYIDLIRHYRQGDYGATVLELSRWEPARLRAEARRLALSTNSMFDDPRGESEQDRKDRLALLEAVVLLHTEVLLRGAWDSTHFDQVWRAVKVLSKWPQAAPFVQSAHIVLGSRLASLFRPDDALQLLQSADGSGETLLAIGSLSESAAVRGIPTPGSRGFGSTLFGTLRNASETYEAALRLDPSLTEARLRLGRLLVVTGFLDAAVPHLERARREAPEGFLAYLAALFLGAAREQQRSWDVAADCYRAALAEYPESQTAYLALGHVLELAGHPDEGWADVRRMFGEDSAPRNPERDPWWVYFDGQFWQVQHRIDRMRDMMAR